MWQVFQAWVLVHTAVLDMELGIILHIQGVGMSMTTRFRIFSTTIAAVQLQGWTTCSWILYDVSAVHYRVVWMLQPRLHFGWRRPEASGWPLQGIHWMTERFHVSRLWKHRTCTYVNYARFTSPAMPQGLNSFVCHGFDLTWESRLGSKDEFLFEVAQSLCTNSLLCASGRGNIDQMY